MTELSLGQRAEITRKFGEQDIVEYIALTGDSNPIYYDQDEARKVGYSGLAVPGALIGGMFSTLLGTKLPGGGTNYLKQSLRFLHLASANDEFTAAVEIVRLRPEKELVNLRTVCINQAGETVCEGEALVLVRDIQTGPSVIKG